MDYLKNELTEWTDFLHAGANSKGYFNDSRMGFVKNGHVHLVHKTLKSSV